MNRIDRSTIEWEPYLTATESYMRRRRWYGWQKRKMTPEECAAHFEQFWLPENPDGVYNPSGCA